MSVVATAVLGAGCEVQQVPPPPVSVREYEDANAHPYPSRTIADHNLRRALDPDLPEAQRLESLRLAARLGRNDPDTRTQLAALPADPANSPTFRDGAREILLAEGVPDVVTSIPKLLWTLSPDDPLTEQVLTMLERKATADALPGLITLWAKETQIRTPREPRYREIIEAVSGAKWDEILLGAANSPSFDARVAALEVLAARTSRDRLARSILALSAKSDGVTAAQVFMSRFNYLPTTPAALAQCTWLYKEKLAELDGAARLSAVWAKNSGYWFDVRDFHLLSRLGRDPLRRNRRRTQLVVALARSFIKRPHVHRRVATPTGLYDFSDRFSKLFESLTMVDLWNLVLLDEMLSQPGAQGVLGLPAGGSRAESRAAWGGWVFYTGGHAEARPYPPSVRRGSSDTRYIPTEQAVRTGWDALCLYHGRFEENPDTGRVGPLVEDLQAARRGNHYGLALTRLGRDAFCAHYYNPQGIAISIGKFSIRSP